MSFTTNYFFLFRIKRNRKKGVFPSYVELRGVAHMSFRDKKRKKKQQKNNHVILFMFEIKNVGYHSPFLEQNSL